MPGQDSRARANPFNANLPGWFYYGLIICGVATGMFLCCLGGWMFIDDNGKPSGGRTWDESASQFVLPISAIVGATFGGITGVALATGLTSILRCKSSEVRKEP